MSSFIAGTCEVDVFGDFPACDEPGTEWVDGVLVCRHHDKVLHGSDERRYVTFDDEDR